jgi:hypothetical protein
VADRVAAGAVRNWRKHKAVAVLRVPSATGSLSVGSTTADIALLQLFTRRTGALLRHQKKRGILRSVKDPKHGRFDIWEIAV